MSGQALVGPGGLVNWHPRDVDTLRAYYEDQASQARMEAERERIKSMTGGS